SNTGGRNPELGPNLVGQPEPLLQRVVADILRVHRSLVRLRALDLARESQRARVARLQFADARGRVGRVADLGVVLRAARLSLHDQVDVALHAAPLRTEVAHDAEGVLQLGVPGEAGPRRVIASG